MKGELLLRNLFNVRYCLDNILQRPYEWDNKRVKKLITDLMQKKHNIGDIITWQSEDGVKYLFDGQQRMATIYILLANIYNHYPIESIKYMLFCNSYENGIKPVKRLTLREKDDAALLSIVNNEKPLKSKLSMAYKFISEEFTNEMSNDELETFFQTINDNLRYFERECDDRNEGIEQFERLNGWGQPLEAGRLGISKLYSIYNYNLNKYNEKTREFLHKLSNMDDRDARAAIALYLYYKTGEYREYGFPNRIDILTEKKCDVLKDFYDFYNGIYQDVIDNKNVLYQNTIFKKNAALKCIYVDIYSNKFEAISELSDKDKVNVYKAFEWAFISNKIMGASTNPIPKLTGILHNYTKENGEDVIDYVVNCLKSKGLYVDPDAIKDYSVDNSQFYRSLFNRIEYQYCTENKRFDETELSDKASIEHIYPKVPKEGLNISKELIETIGNKTILNIRFNTSISNDNFTNKRERYSSSKYLINSQHLCKYTEWGDEQVRDNANWYVEILKRFYNIAS